MIEPQCIPLDRLSQGLVARHRRARSLATVVYFDAKTEADLASSKGSSRARSC